MKTLRTLLVLGTAAALSAGVFAQTGSAPRRGQNQRGPAAQQRGQNQQKGTPSDDPQGGGQGGQQTGRPTSRPSPEALFDEADSNKDGSLSRDEFKSFLESHRPPRPPRGQGGPGGGGPGGAQGGQDGETGAGKS